MHQQKAWSKAAASLLRKGNLSMIPNLTNLLLKRAKEGNLTLINPDWETYLFLPSEEPRGSLYYIFLKQAIDNM